MIKNNKVLFIILLAPIIFLSSCAKKYDLITKEVVSSQISVQPQGKGTILGSVSTNRRLTNSYASITLKQLSTGKIQLLSANTKDNNKNSSPKGRTYLINLDPGKYAITNWRLSIPGYLFDISVGDYLYLGNFHLEVVSGKNIFGIIIPAGVDIKVRDKKERDIKDLKRKFPKLPADKITVNLITL